MEIDDVTTAINKIDINHNAPKDLAKEFPTYSPPNSFTPNTFKAKYEKQSFIDSKKPPKKNIDNNKSQHEYTVDNQNYSTFDCYMLESQIDLLHKSRTRTNLLDYVKPLVAPYEGFREIKW